MSPPESNHPTENVDPRATDDALHRWLTGIDEDIAAIPDTEHQAATDRILTEAGYDRDPDGHLRRTTGADHE